MSDMDDLFKEFFESGASIAPPTPEEIRKEAMVATELHIAAFNDAIDSNETAWHDMLPEWAEELNHYLKVLEDFEEYEQCAKVFKCLREIREVHNNLQLNESLKSLEYTIVKEEPSDEPDF